MISRGRRGTAAEVAWPREQTLRLADGRALTIAEYGDRNAAALFYFHGLGGSRFELGLGGEEIAHAPFRLIAIDRPGYGGSDPRSGRSLLDWPDDVAEAADALGIRRFPVLGVSGGAPYAMACAWRLGDRVESVALACGLGPLDTPAAVRDLSLLKRLGFRFSDQAPGLVRRILAPLVRRARSRPERTVDYLIGTLPPQDRRALNDPARRAALGRSLLEALRQGVEGVLSDMILYARPWPFAIEALDTRVHIWHGEADTVVPPSMARAMARRLPGARLQLRSDEGHFSLVFNYFEEIVGALID